MDGWAQESNSQHDALQKATASIQRVTRQYIAVRYMNSSLDGALSSHKIQLSIKVD